MPEPVNFRADEAFAHAMDATDPLRALREEFAIPTLGGVGAKPSADARGSASAVYLTGNSLGAMPKRVPELLAGELEDWARRGVEGHMHGRDPWLPVHEQFRGPLGRLARPTRLLTSQRLWRRSFLHRPMSKPSMLKDGAGSRRRQGGSGIDRPAGPRADTATVRLGRLRLR